MKKSQVNLIIKKSISLDEFSRNFTQEQERMVQDEIRYYDVLVELKKLRLKLGLTQEQLAQKAELPRTTVTKIESGTYNPTLNTIMVLASAMDKKIQLRLI